MAPITRLSARRRDWSALPEGVLALIATRLELIEDFIAFRLTCTTWRSRTTFMDFDSVGSCPKLPLLMLYKHEHVYYHMRKTVNPRTGRESTRLVMANLPDEREVRSLSKRKTSTFSIPEASGMVCRSTKGWLIMVERLTGVMCLFHPLTRERIQIPNAPPNVVIPCLMSAVLSASPSETLDYVVMIAYMEKDTSCVSSSYVGFWKPGNEMWTRVEIPGPVEDLNYYNGKFYGLTYSGKVLMIDWFSGPELNYKVSEIIELRLGRSVPRSKLVESEGRLLIVSPFYDNRIDSQYKEDLLMGEIDVINLSYTSITSLGQSTVFLGDNQAFSIDANRFPGILEPNSIYFSNVLYRIAVRGRKHKSVPVPQICWGVWINF